MQPLLTGGAPRLVCGLTLRWCVTVAVLCGCVAAAHIGLLWTLVKLQLQATGELRPSPHTNSPAVPPTNMVHCTVVGDDVFGPCHGEYSCTQSSVHRSDTCEVSPIGSPERAQHLNVSCCLPPPEPATAACAGTTDRLSCHINVPTFSAADIKACASKECAKGFDTGFCIGNKTDPQEVECVTDVREVPGAGYGYDVLASTSARCTIPPTIIAGSFEWKISYAANHGCVAVGGFTAMVDDSMCCCPNGQPSDATGLCPPTDSTSYTFCNNATCGPQGTCVHNARDATTAAPCNRISPTFVQGFFCPKSMQQGPRAKVDSLNGQIDSHRPWGECNIPQTPSTVRGDPLGTRHATTTIAP